MGNKTILTGIECLIIFFETLTDIVGIQNSCLRRPAHAVPAKQFHVGMDHFMKSGKPGEIYAEHGNPLVNAQRAFNIGKQGMLLKEGDTAYAATDGMFRVNAQDRQPYVPPEEFDETVRSGVREYELKWQLVNVSDYAQLVTFFDSIGNTGTVFIDLPKFGSSTYVFQTYSGCYIREPEAGQYFAGTGQQEVLVLVTNIRTV